MFLGKLKFTQLMAKRKKRKNSFERTNKSLTKIITNVNNKLETTLKKNPVLKLFV